LTFDAKPQEIDSLKSNLISSTGDDGSGGGFVCTSEASGFHDGIGTLESPYQICSWSQLNATRNNLSCSYVLISDLSSSDLNYSGLGDDWQPIGTGSGADSFSGNFNGNGYTISNLTINKPEVNCVGLFGVVSGNITNVDLNVVSVTGQNSVGGLVGNQISGTISSSSATVSGNVTASSWNAGGLVGYQDGGTISDSSATVSGNVTAGTWNAGGLVGVSHGTISSSSATVSGSVSSAVNDVGGLVGYQNGGTISDSSATISGSVTASNQYAGGLVGRQSSGTISNSYATGSVSGNEDVGGLVGYSGGTISNSYSTGNVSGNKKVGGLVSSSGGTISNSYSTGNVSGNEKVGGLVGRQSSGTISNSYSTGNVTGSSAVGGLVGIREGGNTINSYWNNQTSGQSTSAGGTGKTTAEMKTQNTFAGWDFPSIWNINEGTSYPYLQWQNL